jgi:hypothetical protein
MLMSLSAEFVRSQMILLVMGDGCGHVGMGCEVVEFGGALVFSLCHEQDPLFDADCLT